MSHPPEICPALTELQRLLDGLLPEDKTDELAGHLEHCPECRASLDRLAAGDDWTQQVAKHLSRRGGESIAVSRLAERWQKQVGEAEPARDDLDRLEFLEPASEPGVLGMLGPYEITETIGRGGFGLVLKGRDPRLNRIVAVKVLAPEWASNAMARKRFLREAQAAAAVRHDHVVTIYAVDEVAKLPYLVMEYVPGKSLQQRLDEQGPLEVREILRIGRQIALGLSAAHSEGLIHRDIKPGNVLLEDGIQRVKITDFGLARAVDDVGMTQTGTVAGTPEYMSPEQAWGGPVDHRTDLFSLGGVLYAMCTGRSPFRAKSVLAVLRRVSEDEPRPIEEINPDVPYALIALIEQLLAKDPSQRLGSAQEVAELLGAQLSAIQNAETVHMPSEANPENAMPPWLLYKMEKVPLDTWSWIAENFRRANGWGQGLWPWSRRKRLEPRQRERRVRWPLMLLIGALCGLILPLVMIPVLDRLEGRGRSFHNPIGVSAKTATVSNQPAEIRPPAPWSPPLISANELTLDVHDPSMKISIDGQPYSFDPDKPHIRLGNGWHRINLADADGSPFDELEFSMPTSESYLRIDRSGIVQSARPANVKVKWISVGPGIRSLRFQGAGERVLGVDVSAGGELLSWPIEDEPKESASGHASDFVTFGIQHSNEATRAHATERAAGWAVSSDGKFAAIGTGEQNREVRLMEIADQDPDNWDRQMNLTQHPGGIQKIAFSPDGRLLLCSSADWIEIFRLDGLVATPLGEIPRPAERAFVSNARFLPDNRRFLICDTNGNLELWNTRPLERETAFQNSPAGKSDIHNIDFDASGRRALLASAEGVCLFDLQQGKVIARPDWPGGKSLEIRKVSFLPDDRHAALVIYDRLEAGRTEFWVGDTQTGRIIARLDVLEALRIGHSAVDCHDLRFSADGRRIRSACLVENEQFHAIAIVDWAVPEKAFAAETETASPNKVLQLAQTLNTSGEPSSVAFAPDGSEFITGDAAGGQSAVWSVADGKIVHQLSAGDSQTAGESRIALSPDGKMIAECRGDFLRLWNRETGTPTIEKRLYEPMKRKEGTINRIQAIRSVDWSADGQTLLIGCPMPVFREGEQVRSMGTAYAFFVQIEAEEVKIVKRLAHPHDVTGALFLDENRIATACEDGRVRIWDTTSSKTLHEFRTGDEAILCLDATADGAYVAAGSADGNWHLWETRYGVRLNHWTAESAVSAVAFLPEENRLVTAHSDGQLVLWSLAELREIGRARGNPGIADLAVTGKGGHCLTISKGHSAVQLWRTQDEE